MIENLEHAYHHRPQYRRKSFRFSFLEQPPMGEEDCLFLDVVVPGGVSSDRKKPVMLWIHGGGYTLGHRMQYIPAVLAEHGDVIVVTINYRLGIFGFLSDGPGTVSVSFLLLCQGTYRHGTLP